MGRSTQTLDKLFQALSDPTRRRVLERLNQSPASVSELAEPFEIALPSFVQHLTVLKSVGLVKSKKCGRTRTYTLVPKRLELAESWLSRQRDHWEKAAGRAR